MMKKNDIRAEINVFFSESDVFTSEDLRNFFRRKEPDIPNATVNWRIHDLVISDIISRIGRGKYQLGAGNIYRPTFSARALKISKFIKREFPLIKYCVWDTALLNEFAHHLSGYHYILVDVERDVIDSVYYRLKDEFTGVFLNPSEFFISDILTNFRSPLAIRNLPSESPLNEQEKVPLITIEKLLVDVYCDQEFTFMAGSELRAIFSNAFLKYTVNKSKLLRYAARKGRRADIHKYVNEGGFQSQKHKPS